MATRRRVIADIPRKSAAIRLESIRVFVLPDEDQDTSHLEQEEFADRARAYEAGEFNFVGVRAEATIVVESIVQRIVSGGHWGIESDSDKTYFEEVAQGEYADLRKILKSIGVPTAQLPTEMDPDWIEWRA